MLEGGRAPAAPVVKHLDRCLCLLHDDLSSGVHYSHLIARARTHIEQTYVRPWPDRLQQRLLATRVPIRCCSASCPRLAGSPGHSRAAAGRQAMVANAPKRRTPRGRSAAGLRRRGTRRSGSCSRLRAAGAQAGDQRGDGAATDPPRLRDGGCRRSGCCGAVFHQLGLEERAKAAAKQTSPRGGG